MGDHRQLNARRRMKLKGIPEWRNDPDYFAAERIRAKRRKAISLREPSSYEARERDKASNMEITMVKVPDTALAEAISKAVANLGVKQAKKGKQAKGRSKPTAEETAARMAANDAECIRVFEKAGFKDVKPRVNVLTYGKVKPDGTVSGWLGQGRKVKAGEKSHAVGPFRLFHISQTEPVPAAKESNTVH